MRAVVFDLDGLLVDSEPIHQQAFNMFLERHQVSHRFEEEEYGRVFVGVPVSENMRWIQAEFGIEGEPDAMLAEREAIYEELISDQRNLVAMPGVTEVLDRLDQMGIVLGVATGSPRRQAETILRGMGIGERFRTMVSGTDVLVSKPAPDVYLRAMENLGLTSSECVAVEDSAAGVDAAKNAGLRVIAVPNRFTRNQDLSRADARAENLIQVLTLIQ